MNIITLKVLVEYKSTIYRDIQIDENRTLLELFQLIKKAFNFTGNQLASFIVDDEDYNNMKEFPLVNVSGNEQRLMADVTCGELFKDNDDQLQLTYDYLNEWKFYLEVIKIEKTSDSTPALAVVKKYGNAPKENEKMMNGEDAEKIILNEMLGEDLDDSLDEYNEDDPFSSGNMDSIDDYEEYL